MNQANEEQMKIFAKDDLSPDAIEHRFNCGSWNEKDVRHIIKELRENATLRAELERLTELFPVEGKFSLQEEKILQELAIKQEMSGLGVLRQGLRIYQLIVAGTHELRERVNDS
jgi:hypothetical protein